MTMSGPLRFRIFAVSVSVMVIGCGPQSKGMMPPCAMAETVAVDVQLADVPFPTTRVGCDVSAAPASGGIGAWPFGFPGGTTHPATTITRETTATRGSPRDR